MMGKGHCGNHVFWYQSGVVHVEYHGSVSAEDLAELRKKFAAWIVPSRPTFYVVDARGITGITADARQEMYASYLTNEMCAAVFGAPFALRVVVNLIARAIRMVSPKIVVRYFAEEFEALQWLDAQMRMHGEQNVEKSLRR